MTLTDMMNWKGNISFQELEKLLNQKQKLERKIHKLSIDRDFIEDALSLFSPSDDKYSHYVNKLEDINIKAMDLSSQLSSIEELIQEA